MPRAAAATTRGRILDVTAELMRTAGIAGATTREIARSAGLTEAALYRHFKSKEDLLSCVLAERLPVFIGILQELPSQVGQNTVHATLRRVAEAAVPFYGKVMPVLAAIFGDPNLLARHRAWAQASGLGPQRGNAALAGYIRAEQVVGRLPATLDADALTALLLGACLQRAFLDEFLGRESDAASIAAFAESLVQTLLPNSG
jgi:AcrR family transcriptional regulator